MKNTVQKTSLEAYESLSKDGLREIYKEIIFALKNMPEGGTSFMIAAAAKRPEEKIRKRLSELGGIGVIYKPGHRLVTPSGRSAYVWKLMSQETKIEQIEPLKGPSVQDYARNIAALTQQSLF